MDSEKIRILRVIARLNIGGPALHVGLVSRGLDELGFETTLAAGSLAAGEGDMAGFARSLGVQAEQAIREVTLSKMEVCDAVCLVLILRFYKRITAHLSNICTTVVMPVDLLDFYDEPGGYHGADAGKDAQEPQDREESEDSGS